MSFRRPKAQVVRADISDLEEEEEVKNAINVDRSKSSTSKKGKLSRNVKMFRFEDEEDSNDEMDRSFDRNKPQVKKEEKKSNKITMPKFNEFNEDAPDRDLHALEALKKQSIATKRTESQKEREEDHIIVASDDTENVQDDSKKVELIQSDRIDDFRHEQTNNSDFISLKLSNNEGHTEIFGTLDGQNLLNDGRLPLTENEEILERSARQKQMEEAFNEVDISTDNEVEDWEASKLRSGTILKSDTNNEVRIPKLNIVEDSTVENQKQEVEDIIQLLKARQQENSLKIKQVTSKRAGLELQKVDIVQKLQNIAQSYQSL